MRDWNKQAWFDWTKIYGFGTGRPLPLTTLAPYVAGRQGHDPMGADFNPWMNMLGRDGDLFNTEPAKNAHFAPSIFDQKSDDDCEDLYPELCQAHLSQDNCRLEEFWAKCGKTCSMCHATKVRNCTAQKKLINSAFVFEPFWKKAELRFIFVKAEFS